MSNPSTDAIGNPNVANDNISLASGTISANKVSIEHDKYLFDCDQLINLCSNIEKLKIEEQTESMLEVRLHDLDTWFKKFQDSYETLILSPSTSDTRDFKENAKVNYTVCSETYYVARSHIIEMMRLSQNYNFSTDTNRYTIPQSLKFQQFGPRQPSDDNSGVYLKVPACDTESFEGGYEEWPSFRDMFTAVYVNHPKLTRAQKLYHLRNKTKGDAGAIVKRYPLCDDNFDLAWNALKARYDNKRVLVDKQLRILFDIPVAADENSESINKIHATVVDCLSMLKSLNVPTDGWDPILIHLISTKLPGNTLSLWEQSLKSHRELPKWSQMDEFLNNRFEVVERISSVRTIKTYTSNMTTKNKIQTYHSQDKLNSKCTLCDADHSIRICPEFRKFTPQQRIDFVFKNKYCNNCLASNHTKGNCKSKNTCIVCKKNHHTLLHIQSKYSNSNSDNSSGPSRDSKQVSRNNSKIDYETPSTSSQARSAQVQANFSSNNEPILLRTALVQIRHCGELFTTRALIDPGSQRTFVSEKLRKLLKLPYHKSHFEIIGIGGQSQSSDKECEIEIFSPRKKFSFTINAIVLPKVTRRIPSASFIISNPEELEQLDLADPYFNQSSQIDLIIGNDSERFINLDGVIKNICGGTSAYNTIFGWVLSGPIKATHVQSFSTTVFPSDTPELTDLVRKFWEQEEVPNIRQCTPEDEFCENFYQKTTTRQDDGRYVVRLPFKQEFPDTVYLGSSRFLALGQFSRMEQNLSKNPELQEQYKSVLNEYLDLGHMEESSPTEISQNDKFNSFYLPHHAVVRPEHKTTKVRVVFNASRKTKSGFSLNDVLYTGPTLQTDLIATILNWRQYKYVFSGDIQKMYRQILVHPADRNYQRILHQKDNSSPIRDYCLTTVTFGVNCAPFLAIRTLKQLAVDSKSKLPLAAAVIENESYVDDILSGGFSIEEAILKRQQLITALNSAGFPLKKITANDPRLLLNLPTDDLYDQHFLRFQESSSVKTLGIKWNALTDTFSYAFPIQPNKGKVSKRKVLSVVASLYDPIGWITPIVMRAKLLMQQIWLEGGGWDDEISPDSHTIWDDFLLDLAYIELVSIPRWMQYKPSDVVQIHGFCDASKAAYCACVYIRCQTHNNVTFSNIIISKTKVAPLKTISLPRLELNGAVLLAKLVKYITSTLKFNIGDTILWTDASIVLGWLSKTPSTWETFVANRTSQVHELVPNATWRHVSTHDNPADLGTRGSRPQDLANNTLWWNGPPWICNPPSTWPETDPLFTKAPMENSKQVHSFVTCTGDHDILSRFSSYAKSLRVLSYVFRFYHGTHAMHKNNHTFTSTSVDYKEILFVKTRLISLAQIQFFKEEYDSLTQARPIPDKSSLKSLNPYMDSQNIMRVNGRLTEAPLPFNESHPIILPGKSRFCHLYLAHLHQYLMHAECSLMCRMTQTEFYISRLKRKVKSIIRDCKTCTIFKQRQCSQIMAPLPADRCSLTPPFHTTGIDFAGPVELKSSNVRQSPYIKGYVCVFVCFSTKAIHLEVCSELSSASFEATFARFVGRRGLPHRVVTDNGRNFLGSSRALLKEFRNFLKTASSDIAQKYATHGFEWSFIPPHAPHMGGLWEAAVKSFKFHFKRIAGTHKFTYEQCSTVLARIEGVLNSRPISAMSEDPNDLTALTPGHFLRGSPMLSLPEPNCQNLSLINRWLKLKALHHEFSIRWKEDYLKSLHKRYKWKIPIPNLNIGDLVVVMDDLLPPNEWRLGRIEKTHEGSDSRVRIADVRTANGTITRPIVKLCALPYNQQEGHY